MPVITKNVSWLSTADVLTNKEGTEKYNILAINPDGRHIHISTDCGSVTYRDTASVYCLVK